MAMTVQHRLGPMTLNILRLPRLIAERRSTAILGMLIIGLL